MGVDCWWYCRWMSSCLYQCLSFLTPHQKQLFDMFYVPQPLEIIKIRLRSSRRLLFFPVPALFADSNSLGEKKCKEKSRRAPWDIAPRVLCTLSSNSVLSDCTRERLLVYVAMFHSLLSTSLRMPFSTPRSEVYLSDYQVVFQICSS